MIFNIDGGSTAEQIKYDNSKSGLESENVQAAVDELTDSLTNENNESFNFGVKDGVRGFYTDPSRADDCFIPFSKFMGTHLYYFGTDFENITGGWDDTLIISDQPNKTPHEKTDRYIYLKSTSTGNQSNCTTKKKIDITKFNTLHFTGVIVGGNFRVSFSKDDKDLESSNTISYRDFSNAGEYADGTIDVSSISGEYYLSFSISNGSSRNAKIYDVWFE